MINEALRLVRVFHDYKSYELAEKLGISASYLSEIENGKKKPSFELLNKYSEVFNMRPSTILFFSEELNNSIPKDCIKDKMRNYILKLMLNLESQELNHEENQKL